MDNFHELVPFENLISTALQCGDPGNVDTKTVSTVYHKPLKRLNEKFTSRIT